jgi:hypothetical protein
MGNGHEPVQGGPTEDGVEGEVDLCDVEDDVLRAVVLMHPESYREGDATTWNDGAGSHSQKWVRGSELGHRNLQLLESYQTDKVEGYLTINQDVYNLMLAMVGEKTSGSCSAHTMFLGQSEASKLIDVSIHL